MQIQSTAKCKTSTVTVHSFVRFYGPVRALITIYPLTQRLRRTLIPKSVHKFKKICMYEVHSFLCVFLCLLIVLNFSRIPSYFPTVFFFASFFININCNQNRSGTSLKYESYTLYSRLILKISISIYSIKLT